MKLDEFFSYDQLYMTLLEMGMKDIDQYLRLQLREKQ